MRKNGAGSIRVLNRLSIQSKVVLMLLLVSLGSLSVIAYLGYDSGRRSLEAALRRQLTSVRTVKTNLLYAEFETIRDVTIVLAGSERATSAMRAFQTAFEELNERTVPPEWDDKLTGFYRDEFLPALARNVEGEPVLEIYQPRLIPTRFLQYHYIANNPEPYERKGRSDVSDDSSYGLVHDRFHKLFRGVADRFGFQDVMLVDSDTGDVVYTYQKTVEFGTNLIDGPYADSVVGRLYQTARKGMDRGSFQLTDFERYRPNLNLPAAFIASPIFDENTMIGLLILQFPLERINRLTTGNYQWEREGLGKSGETYLVGPDHRMRTRSRFMHEDPEGLVMQLKAQGASSKLIDQIERNGSLILNLEVKTPAVERALAGEEGIVMQEDYRKVPVLASYAPVELEGVRWAIVTEIDADEVMAPIRAYGRDVLRSTVGIILVVTALAILLSHWLVRPLQQLAHGARKVSSGNVDVQIKCRSRDEFGDLAEAFNGMVRSLKAKTDLVEQKNREYEDLLLSILPGPVAARMRDGAQQISDSFADVTVMYADITGFTELTENLPAEQSIAMLHELVVAFDEAADRFGVEKVKTLGSGYMAVCGLSVQRPDHANRVVEFAMELKRILKRFNDEHDTTLGLVIGINAGPVVGGVVGRSKFLYDLWGDTVNLARRMQEVGANGKTVRVSEAVYHRLKDMHTFDRCGEIEIPGKGAQIVWGVRG